MKRPIISLFVAMLIVLPLSASAQGVIGSASLSSELMVLSNDHFNIAERELDLEQLQRLRDQLLLENSRPSSEVGSFVENDWLRLRNISINNRPSSSPKMAMEIAVAVPEPTLPALIVVGVSCGAWIRRSRK